MTVVVVSFAFFLLCFIGVGIVSAKRRKNTTDDYLLASRSVSPWVMALSAVATNNSGFMFIGLIGMTYTDGISSLALMAGWVLGDYVAWLVGIPKALREKSEQGGSATIPSFLGQGLAGGKWVVKVAGLIVLAFLGTYAAAQLTAGGKALHALFDWDMVTGVVLGALIVVAYCFAGGIRASIWTDVAQSIVMFAAMTLLLLVGVLEAGGPGFVLSFASCTLVPSELPADPYLVAIKSVRIPAALWTKLEAIDPQLLSFVPRDAPFGFAMFLLGWLAAGFGVVGQPHIMIRAMAIDSPVNMPAARRVYVVWNVLFSIAAVGVGLVARLLLDEKSVFDPELAMPFLSQDLLPPVLVGLVLAGLFAATMSTADSQVLSCSAAITQDLLPRPGASHYYNKIGTVIVTLIVLAVALSGESVFALATFAWAGMAASLGPLLVIRCMGRSITSATALAMMIGGLLAVLGWRFGLKYGAGLFEALPGMLAGFLIYGIGNAISGSRSARHRDPD